MRSPLDIAGRFRKLTRPRQRVEVPEPPAPPTKEEQWDAALEAWAQDPRCSGSFLPMLRNRVEVLFELSVAAAESHATVAGYIGAQKELKTLIEKFEKFTGESS